MFSTHFFAEPLTFLSFAENLQCSVRALSNLGFDNAHTRIISKLVKRFIVRNQNLIWFWRTEEWQSITMTVHLLEQGNPKAK